MSADERVSKALQGLAHELNEGLKEIAGEKMAFVLLVAPFDRDGRVSYIANIERMDALELLEGTSKHWRNGLPDIPAHEIQ